jgi:hypothetical protein
MQPACSLRGDSPIASHLPCRLPTTSAAAAAAAPHPSGASSHNARPSEVAALPLRPPSAPHQRSRCCCCCRHHPAAAVWPRRQQQHQQAPASSTMPGASQRHCRRLSRHPPGCGHVPVQQAAVDGAQQHDDHQAGRQDEPRLGGHVGPGGLDQLARHRHAGLYE